MPFGNLMYKKIPLVTWDAKNVLPGSQKHVRNTIQSKGSKASLPPPPPPPDLEIGLSLTHMTRALPQGTSQHRNLKQRTTVAQKCQENLSVAKWRCCEKTSPPTLLLTTSKWTSRNNQINQPLDNLSSNERKIRKIRYGRWFTDDSKSLTHPWLCFQALFFTN